MIEINFKKLNEKAVIPDRKSPLNAGLDLYSIETVTIPPKESAVIHTGIAWEPGATNLYMQIQGRSGLCFKNGIEVCNAGVIDNNYRGEICVKLFNTSLKVYVIHEGDRVAQGVIFYLPEITVKETDELHETDRNIDGFGSSGK